MNGSSNPKRAPDPSYHRIPEAEEKTGKVNLYSRAGGDVYLRSDEVTPNYSRVISNHIYICFQIRCRGVTKAVGDDGEP